MCMASEKIHSSPCWPQLSASVLGVRAVCWVGVMGQHVVVHVDGGAVVDWVAQTLGENSLTCVWRQAKQEEAGLSRREAVDRLEEIRGEIISIYSFEWAYYFNSDDLTLSTLMIWNFWVISAGLEGKRDLPETKRRKSTLSSLVNSCKLCQNQPMSWWLSVMSR